VNPARSLATAVFQGGWALNQLWVFIVFPIVGAILGAAIWRTLRPECDEESEAESEAVAPAPFGKREMPGQ
jgi:aquaporin Z